jgi:cyclopropane fatty-acyl-phospholipid synthase-like methyltransferase
MSKIEKQNWEERFSSEEYVYGTDPNVFLKEQLDKLSAGRLLLLGEGEGRNAVYAAKMNWQVDAVDFSEQARLKALNLAAMEKVKINYTISNLNDYQPESNYYDAIGIIYFHLDKLELKKIFAAAKDALKKGGIIICEVFSKNQLGRTSGGPKVPELLYSLDEIKNMFKGLETITLEECSVELDEGVLHRGEAMVIRYVGKK